MDSLYNYSNKRDLMIPNLSKDMIDIMQQLRKRLRSEFGVELKLSQPDIVHFELCEQKPRSENPAAVCRFRRHDGR